MTMFPVARAETMRIARGCLPLAVLTYAAFALAGEYGLSTVLGLVPGTLFAIWNFYAMACAAERWAQMGDPARAQRAMTRSYIVRYLLMAALIVGAVMLEPVNALAAAIPLFYPKLILLASGLFQKKGGKTE